MDSNFNPAKQHKLTIAYQQAVNAAIKRHKEGELTLAGFRRLLAKLRFHHNFGDCGEPYLAQFRKPISIYEAAQ